MPSKLDQLQAKFRERIDQQKEEKLSSIRIYNDNQQRVLERVSKSNGSEPINGSSSNGNYSNGNQSSTNNVGMNEIRKPASLGLTHPPTRKHGSGVDRSRPLKPMLIKPAFKSQQQSLGTSSEQSAFGATALNKNLTGSGTMVLKSRPRATSASSAATNGGAASRLVSPQTRTAPPSTKVEVKKTAAGNKVVSTTVKPNEITKVTVETIKKATPPSSTGHSVTTTVKTTIHKRTITPIKTSPSSRNGHSESNGTKSSSLVTSTPKSTPTALSRRVSSGPPSSSKSSSTPISGRTSSSAPVAKKSSPPTDPNMSQCAICGRNFAKDRIEKHEVICQKTSLKKRKPFDATKMRVKGTEAEQFVRRGAHKKEDPKVSLNKKSNWRSKHEEFINSIRQAKLVQKHLEAGGKLSDLPPPKPSENPDYVPCPHCGRKFNEGVAERHIPKCKNIVSNKKTPIKKK